MPVWRQWIEQVICTGRNIPINNLLKQMIIFIVKGDKQNGRDSV